MPAPVWETLRTGAAYRRFFARGLLKNRSHGLGARRIFFSLDYRDQQSPRAGHGVMGLTLFLLVYKPDPTQLEVGATLLDPPPTKFLPYDERMAISLFATLRSPGWLALMSRSACPRRPVPSTSSARNFARNGSTYVWPNAVKSATLEAHEPEPPGAPSGRP